jgi:hypothetical protein
MMLGAQKMNTPIWRVMAWNPVQMAWTVRSTHTDPVLAAEQADALRHETQRWRHQNAARMSDLADANKRYKSPG